MSKLFKELNYDTDRVMQPGDPITSPNGNTSVSANNNGTATLSSPYVKEVVASASGSSEDSGGLVISYHMSFTSENTIAELTSGVEPTTISGTLTITPPSPATPTTYTATWTKIPEEGAPVYTNSDNGYSIYFGQSYCQIFSNSFGMDCQYTTQQKTGTTTKQLEVTDHTNPASSITGQLAIANGGTGASTASAALTNLGVPAAIQEKAGWLKNDGTSYSHPDANGKIVLIGGKYQSFRSLDFQDLNNIQVVKESGTENDCKIAVVGVRNLTGAQATIWGAYINASNYVYRVYWVNNGSYWLMQQYPPPIERTTAYATCSTASGTATKVVTVDGGGFTLSSGATVCVKFSAASTDSSPKLNVNSTGGKAIYYNGSAASSTNPFKWSANTTVTFVYDGTGWDAVGVPTHYYATCSTTASTQAKVVTVQGGTGFVLTAGTMVDIRFTTANTYAGAATLNINSTGALTIRFNRSAVNGTNNPLFWTQTATLTFQLYPGRTSYWDVVNCERTEHAPCTTDAATVAKTGTLLARGIALAQGSRVVVKFTYANTAASPTFTMGGVGPYPICDSQGNALTADSVENWGADEIVVFVFSYNSTKSAFQYQIENSYLAKKLASSIPAAQVSSDWNATSGVAQILNKPTLGTAASKNVGTGSSDVASGDHTHSDYVSKSATTDQAMSSSLTFPAGKSVEIGSFASALTYVASMYASSADSYIACGTGEQYTWIDKDGIKHTTDGENTVSTLLFPAASSTSRTIATDYDIRKRTRVLYESVIGDSSTPASAVTISEDYNIYHFWIGTNGTFPTFTFSFPNFESISARFPFTLIAHVASDATTLTGPSGWAWTSGAGLPTSGFAGKVLWISGFKKTNDSTEIPLVSCWRCA